MLYLYILYLKFSEKTEDSQLRNELINDVKDILFELITLKMYFAIRRSNNVQTLYNSTYNIIIRFHWTFIALLFHMPHANLKCSAVKQLTVIILYVECKEKLSSILKSETT